MKTVKSKVHSAAAAAALVRSGDTITTSGFVGIGMPDELLQALDERFVETGSPRDLTLVFAAAPGDGKDRGLNRLRTRGCRRRAIGGHWALVAEPRRLAGDGKIEAYNLPLGIISHLYRDIAAATAPGR